jgi:hypothetical protein
MFDMILHQEFQKGKKRGGGGGLGYTQKLNKFEREFFFIDFKGESNFLKCLPIPKEKVVRSCKIKC